MNIYSQRDPRWNKRKLGNSKTETFGSVGCLVTSVSMIVNSDPPDTNAILVSNGYFYLEPYGAYLRFPYGLELFGKPKMTKDLGRLGEYRYNPFPYVDELLAAPYALVEVNFRRVGVRSIMGPKKYEDASLSVQKIRTAIPSTYMQHFVACIAGVFYDPWYGDQFDIARRYGNGKPGRVGIADAVCRAILP